LRAEIVRLVLGSGSFDWEDTVLTADTFGFFSISLFAQSLIPVLTRAFFDRQDTKTPVITSFISMILNFVLAYLLSFKLGVMGLALAFSLASIINMILLIIILRVRLGELNDYQIIHSTLKIIAASLFMGIITQIMKYFIGSAVNMQTFMGVLIKAGGSIIFAGLVYLLVAFKFNFNEVDIIKDWLRKIKQQVL
jgi:putative peptidoglycan lipid II flippase